MSPDAWARGAELPKTYAELDQAWLSDLARQKGLARERQSLLDAGVKIRG